MPLSHPDDSKNPRPEWLDQVEKLELPGEFDAFFAARSDLADPESVEILTREITALARRVPDRASRLSVAAWRLAEVVGDDYSYALVAKARGHLDFLRGDYEEALACYRTSQERFLAAGAEVEAAVNLGSSMWMLALMGRYDEAWGDSKRARLILERHSDPVALARVVTNEANVLLRQDRHREALAAYREALALFRRSGGIQDIAVSLHNIAVSSIAMSDFRGALDSYLELKHHCEKQDIPLLAAQADYNIAYLYYFRGEYSRAIEIYQRTRRQCELLGDVYHGALCNLDQAEIYLELNLTDDADRLARLAFEVFDQRDNGYEAAKALTFLALASSQRGEHHRALRGFARASDRFVREGNLAWRAMTDFYSALMHYQLLNPRKARENCLEARAFFRAVPWPGRVALCDLLLAQIDQQRGRPDLGRQRCLIALEQLGALELPALELKALIALGHAEEALGDRSSALAAYRRAHALLEDLRTHLGGEESKIAFLSDKLEVYESLVALTLSEKDSPESLRLAFGYIEQTKSRSLADLVTSGGALRSSPTDSPELVERVRRLRSELTQDHHELSRLYAIQASNLEAATDDAEGAQPDAAASQRSATLRHQLEAVRLRSRECEQLLLGTMRELRSRDSKFAALQSAETTSFDSIRSAIPENAAMLEYFESRGVVYACVVSDRVFEIRRLQETSRIASALRLLRNQMAKFRLGEDYQRRFGASADKTVLACLEQLYAALVEPVEAFLDADHLIVIPHGLLHQVPFHALWSGDVFLLDRFDFSYVPSSSLFALLRKSPPRRHGKSLVLGVPDENTPEILGEVEAVAKYLPGARVFIGDQATAERLRRYGPESEIIHIATHGFFRKDSPMFSAIQLGDSQLTLLDLYGLDLGADLVVLSGCSTGLSRIESGDELIGLTRGFLFAGARSMVISLWDVHDRSTAAFMKSFYRNLPTARNRGQALNRAVREVRSSFSSPYYWAPFVLIGDSEGDYGGA